MPEVDADGVLSQFAKRAFETDVVDGNRNALVLKRANDFLGADGPVEPTFFVGVGLDGNAGASNLLGEGVKVLQLLTALLGKLSLVLFNHATMVIGRDGRKPLGNQVILGVTRLDLDDFALLSQGVDRLDEQELNTAVGSLGETFAGAHGSSGALVSNLHR